MFGHAYDLFIKYHDVYISAFGNTLAAAALGLIFALAVGVIAGVTRYTSRGLAGHVAAVYISIVRNTPMMVQIYFIYFGLPTLGLTLSAFQTGLITLTFNSGAYLAEIIRGGLNAVPMGQVEAARSLGLRRYRILQKVLLPQAAPLVLPAITGQFVQLIKDTSLLYTIAVVELIKAANTVGNDTYQFLEAFLVSWILYLLICVTLNIIIDIYQKRAGFSRHTRA